jgi:hypothetical protein
MLTFDYFAQPGLTRDIHDLNLLAFDLLLILDNNPAQMAPTRLLNRKQEVFDHGREFFSFAYNGSFMSPEGRHSVAFPESIKAYHVLIGCVGPEAKNKTFQGQIEDHCQTLETLASGEQPPEEKLNNLKACLKKMAPDYEKYIKAKPSEKKGASQSETEAALKSLSYVSH